MPLNANFLQGGMGVEYVSSGTLTGGEIIEANEKLYTRENLQKLRYKIIDRTACEEYRVTPDEIKIIADQDKTAAQINRKIIIVLVCTTPLQHGMTRMWQAYAEETGFETEIFSTRASADEWLCDRLHLPPGKCSAP